MPDSSQTTLLRVAAFLVDALTLSIVLILPSSIVSYVMAWSGSDKSVALIWWIAGGVFAVFMLIRDGLRGRSIGKHLLGLRLVTPHGDGCGIGRSIVRNVPVIVPGWNLLELVLVVIGRSRTGDRIARTYVTEE